MVPEGSIVLIKGCDKAQSWEHATFRSSKAGASITFDARPSIHGVPLPIMAELGGSYTSTRDLSPELRNSDNQTPPPGPPTFDLSPLDHAYTVFARFYKIGFRKGLRDRLRGTRTVTIKDTNEKTIFTLPLNQVRHCIIGDVTAVWADVIVKATSRDTSSTSSQASSTTIKSNSGRQVDSGTLDSVPEATDSSSPAAEDPDSIHTSPYVQQSSSLVPISTPTIARGLRASHSVNPSWTMP